MMVCCVAVVHEVSELIFQGFLHQGSECRWENKLLGAIRGLKQTLAHFPTGFHVQRPKYLSGVKSCDIS